MRTTKFRRENRISTMGKKDTILCGLKCLSGECRGFVVNTTACHHYDASLSYKAADYIWIRGELLINIA